MAARSAMTRGVHLGTYSLVVVKASRMLRTLFASRESAAVTSWSSGIVERSIPVQPLTRTRPPMVEAYFFSSSYFSLASSSVRPIMGVKVAKNLMDCGSRPKVAAFSRIAWTLGLRSFGEWEETKMPSAWLAAKVEPAGEVPAWNRKGVRWGEGSMMWRVSRSKYLPWWWMVRILSGSA